MNAPAPHARRANVSFDEKGKRGGQRTTLVLLLLWARLQRFPSERVSTEPRVLRLAHAG